MYVDKCKVLHVGSKNAQFDYSMDERLLASCDDEKDLEVNLSNSLKVHSHIGKCINKANQVLGMIKCSFKYKNRKVMPQLYKSLVRPHLKYAVRAWCNFTRNFPETCHRMFY